MPETLLPLNNFSLDVSLTLLAAYFLKITPIKVTHTKLNSLSLIHTRSSHTPTLLHHTHKRLHQAWFITFLKGCHHPGGSFIYWSKITSVTCKPNEESTNATLTWIVCMRITRGRVDFNWESGVKSHRLVLSFEPATFRPRFSSLCSRTFLTWFGHFHGTTLLGPFKWPVLLGPTCLVTLGPDELCCHRKPLKRIFCRCLQIVKTCFYVSSLRSRRIIIICFSRRLESKFVETIFYYPTSFPQKNNKEATLAFLKRRSKLESKMTGFVLFKFFLSLCKVFRGVLLQRARFLQILSTL